MKQGKVKFSKEFITPIGLKEWASVELEYDMATECPRDVLTNAKEIVTQWHQASSPGFPDNSIPPGLPQTISVERTSEDQRIAELIRDIYVCTELYGDNGLLTYRKVAEANKEACSVFDIMFRKLAPQPKT